MLAERWVSHGGERTCAWLSNGELQCWGQPLGAPRPGKTEDGIPACAPVASGLAVEKLSQSFGDVGPLGRHVTIAGPLSIAWIHCHPGCSAEVAVGNVGLMHTCSGVDRDHLDCGDYPLGARVVASGFQFDPKAPPEGKPSLPWIVQIQALADRVTRTPDKIQWPAFERSCECRRMS